ncbi:atrial natriuretic peptide receptor, putative, partial [Ixodes scapularis]
YVYMGNYLDVQTLLIMMRMKGLTEKGEYLVIMIDHDMQSWEDFNVHFFGAWGPLHVADACPRPCTIRKIKFVMYRLAVSMLHITVFASYLYDSVMLYADAVTKLIHKNHSITDGRAVIREIIGRKRYSSVTGADMSITESGDVEGNYTVLAFLPVAGEDAQRVLLASYLTPVMFSLVLTHSQEFELNANSTVLWKSGQPPLQEPPCGYDGSGCNAPSDNRRQIVASILGVLLVVVSVCTTVVNWKYEQEIAGLLWMIDRRDLEPLSNFSGPKHSMSKATYKLLHCSLVVLVQGAPLFCTLSSKCETSSQKVQDSEMEETSADYILNTALHSCFQMRELHHENVNPFVGACVEPNCIYIVTELCMKGNLQDILENDVIKLDNMFIASFVFDLIKGLRYLHESDLKVHGNLKSSNVLVTSLWVLRLTNFGLLELRTSNASTKSNKDDYQLYRGQMWRSPEVLRNPSAFPRGSQKDDVYAFAIILHEIIGRQGPWGPTDKEPQMIVEAVKKGPMGKELFRPPVEALQCQDYVLHVMHDCWAEKPDSRPELSQVQERLKKMRQGMKPNIMDNMIAMMEKYANNLEELVEERTCLLEEEKKKTEALLHRMLPKSVASQLMRGELVVPESFDFVTIYFSDIVGFTEMSASSTPLQVVTFLNDLYTCFDSIIRHYDVYKVETIGDAYMVVSGLPIRNGDAHAQEIASMALEILDAVKHFEIRHRPGTTLKLRIGIHTGPVVAGVVGQTMPRYCLFGDTVNTASRMESNGEALKIHISSQCRDLLTKIGGYEIIDRGLVKMKGKGELRTYWLT